MKKSEIKKQLAYERKKLKNIQGGFGGASDIGWHMGRIDLLEGMLKAKDKQNLKGE
jgi:hypothetical protein